MFEINKEEHVNRSVRIPRGLADELDKVAYEKEISVNRLVVECCRYALSNIKRGKKAKETVDIGGLEDDEKNVIMEMIRCLRRD